MRGEVVHTAVATLGDACRSYALTLRAGFGHDRQKTVGASEIGQCIRKTVYGKLGLAPDDDVPPDTGFTVRGNIMEDAWSAPMLEHWAACNGGQMLHGGQSNQITLKGGKVPLSSTPDGLCIGMPRDILARDPFFAFTVQDIGPSHAVVPEIKSIDPRYNQSKLPKVPHVPQVVAQIGLIRRSDMGVKPDWGFVFYCDASDYFKVKAWPVEYKDSEFKSLVKRADLIMRTDDPNKVPPEGKMKGGSDCTECPWARQCLGYLPYLSGSDAREPTKDEVAQVEKLASRVRSLEEKEDKAKKARLSAEADLYLKMGEVKRRFVQGTKFKVVARVTASQMRTDAKKLVELATRLGASKEEIEACKSATREGTALSVEQIG